MYSIRNNRNIKESVLGWLFVIHWGIITVRQCLCVWVVVQQSVIDMCDGCIGSDEGKQHQWWCCWGLGQGCMSVLGHGRQGECATGRWHAGGYTRFHFGIRICGMSHWSTGRQASWRLRAGVAQQNSIWRDWLMLASFNGPDVFKVEGGWVLNGFIERAVLGDKGGVFICRQFPCKQLCWPQELWLPLLDTISWCRPRKLRGWLHPEATGSQPSGKFIW